MIKTHLSLVLVDGFFLKYHLENLLLHIMICHNPYFNRWISAIINRLDELAEEQ